MNTYADLTHVKARRDDWMLRDAIELHIYHEKRRNGVSTYSAVTNCELTQITPENEGQHQNTPFRIRMQEAQALMDSLWECGVRPTQGSGSAGSLAATERHLNDMRALVFKTEPKQ